jgi:hypothetical protein
MDNNFNLNPNMNNQQGYGAYNPGTPAVPQYKYDAFISYRHTDLDMFVASELHKYLETYKPPKAALKNSTRGRIQRVFRDQEELPLVSNLEDPIIEALRESEFLIVICSPRIKESAWCKKEIETFIQMHGREKVLAVLIEGEPEESFPDELVKGKRNVTLPTGQVVQEDVIIEPLAADFRAENKAAVKKKMNQEALRLLAPIYGVDFDDLRQRHKERRTRKIIAATTSVAAAAILLAAAAFFVLLMISAQRDKIKKQAEVLEKQTVELKDMNDKISDQNEILAKEQAKNLANEAESLYGEGRRIDAIMMAVSSLTDYQGVQMTYTAHAYNILAKTTRVYTGLSELAPIVNVDMTGQIEYYEVSPDGTYVLATDDLGNLKVWARPTYKEIFEVSDTYNTYELNEAGFASEKEVAYLNKDGEVIIHNLEDDTSDVLCSDMIKCNTNGKYVVVGDSSYEYIYDSSTKECIWQDENDGFSYSYDFVPINDCQYTVFGYDNDLDDNASAYICIVDNSTGELIDKVEFNSDSVDYAGYKDGVIYVGGCILDGGLFDYHSYLLAYDTTNKVVKWKQSVDDALFNNYCLTDNYIGASSYSNLCRFNLEDGTMTNMDYLGESFIYLSSTGDNLWGITSSGDEYYMDYDRDLNMGMPLIRSSDLLSIKSVDNNYIGINRLNSSLIEYGYTYDDNYVEYTGDIPEMEDFAKYNGSDAVTKAEELGVEYPGTVQDLLIYPDTDYVVVNYKNNKMATFDLNTGEKLDYVYATGMYGCYGKDSSDNLYVKGVTSTYAIDSEGMFLFETYSMVGLTDDKNQLILSYKGRDDNNKSITKYATVPIYTTDDLIAKGKKIVKNYRN